MLFVSPVISQTRPWARVEETGERISLSKGHGKPNDSFSAVWVCGRKAVASLGLSDDPTPQTLEN